MLEDCFCVFHEGGVLGVDPIELNNKLNLLINREHALFALRNACIHSHKRAVLVVDQGELHLWGLKELQVGVRQVELVGYGR